MWNLKRVGSALIMVGGIAGAAAAHADLHRVAFDRAAAANIASIDVLEVNQQQPLMLLPSATHFEGAPPANSNKPTTGNPRASQDSLAAGTASLNGGFARGNTTLPAEFGRQLVSALQSDGYNVKLLRGQQPTEKSIGAHQTIAGVTSGADAVLYVVLRFAGYKDDAASGLVPMAGVDAYLFNAKSGKLLYRQVFNAGYKLVNGPDVEFPSIPSTLKFSNRAALMSNGQGAANGLAQALQPVAARIAEQLAK
jgi:hypothetical protein